MNKIMIHVNQETVTAESQRPLIAGSVGVTSFSVEFDKSWQEHVTTIVFTAADYRREISKTVLYTGGEMLVPWEVLELPGELMISVFGSAQGIFQPTAAMNKGLRIWGSGIRPVNAGQEATPELWQQVLENVSQIRENTELVGDAVAAADGAREAAERASQAASQGAAAAQVSAEQAHQACTDAELAREAVENARDMTVYAHTVTLAASAWSETAPYCQSAVVPNMTADWVPGIPVLVPGADAEADLAAREALACICKIISAAGTLTFVCYEEKPEVDITVRVPGLLCAQ